MNEIPLKDRLPADTKLKRTFDSWLGSKILVYDMDAFKIILVGATNDSLIQKYLGTVVFRYYDESDNVPHLITTAETEEDPTNSRSFNTEFGLQIRFRNYLTVCLDSRNNKFMYYEGINYDHAKALPLLHGGPELYLAKEMAHCSFYGDKQESAALLSP